MQILDSNSLSHPGYRVRYAYVPRTPVYIYRIYAQNGAIYAPIMCLCVFYTCVLQFLHVFHERGHHTLDTFVFLRVSVIVCVMEEFPHRVFDIRFIYLTWIIISPPHITIIYLSPTYCLLPRTGHLQCSQGDFGSCSLFRGCSCKQMRLIKLVRCLGLRKVIHQTILWPSLGLLLRYPN
jgi:hypothetical protein